MITDPLSIQVDLDTEETPEQRVKKLLEDQYWAALPYRSEEYAAQVLELFAAHHRMITESSFGQIMWQSWRAYHLMSADYDGWSGDTPITQVQVMGEQGELLSMELPHFRQLVLHKKNLIAADRLAFQPSATTNDGKALEQVSTARHVIDYALDQLGLGKALRDSEEMALVAGCSYVHLGWDPYAGDPTGRRNPTTGKPTYTGNLSHSTLGPWEVAHQQTRQYRDAKWHVVRGFVSKFDLAARLVEQGDPETAEELLQGKYTEQDYLYTLPDAGVGPDGDQVPVYTVYHDRTPAIPEGRMSVITADGLFVSDGPLPYPRAPIFRNCPNELVGSPLPFANSWGWLAVQEQLNAIMSSMITRVDALAHPMISIPEGSDWGQMGPYQIHERAPGQENPFLIDFASMPQAIPGMYSLMLGEGQRLSGINSVVQGSPADNISSGSMAALIHAQALSFANDDVEAYVTTAEQVATGVIQVFQSRASEEMLISIAGSEGSQDYRAFKGDAIKLIKSVTVKRSNPLMKTTAAKQEAATALLSQGLIGSPQEFLSVVESGTYESLFSDATKQLALVKKENGMILEGISPTVGDFEPFHLHLAEHAALEDEYLKTNPQALAALRKHMSETMAKWQKLSMSNPGLLQALKVPVLPPTPAMQAQAQAQGMPVPQAPPQEQPKGKPGPKPRPQIRGVDLKSKMAKGPRMPSMPTPPDTPQEK